MPGFSEKCLHLLVDEDAEPLSGMMMSVGGSHVARLTGGRFMVTGAAKAKIEDVSGSGLRFAEV